MPDAIGDDGLVACGDPAPGRGGWVRRFRAHGQEQFDQAGVGHVVTHQVAVLGEVAEPRRRGCRRQLTGLHSPIVENCEKKVLLGVEVPKQPCRRHAHRVADQPQGRACVASTGDECRRCLYDLGASPDAGLVRASGCCRVGGHAYLASGKLSASQVLRRWYRSFTVCEPRTAGCIWTGLAQPASRVGRVPREGGMPMAASVVRVAVNPLPWVIGADMSWNMNEAVVRSALVDLQPVGFTALHAE